MSSQREMTPEFRQTFFLARKGMLGGQKSLTLYYAREPTCNGRQFFSLLSLFNVSRPGISSYFNLLESFSLEILNFFFYFKRKSPGNKVSQDVCALFRSFYYRLTTNWIITGNCQLYRFITVCNLTLTQALPSILIIEVFLEKWNVSAW